MEHTSGKWQVVYIDENETAVYVPGHKIATLTHPQWDDEAKSNAYLIAAAPDLLAALEFAFYSDETNGLPLEMLLKMEHAINKAKGEQ